jgi:HD superfamily phosphohydrolase
VPPEDKWPTDAILVALKARYTKEHISDYWEAEKGALAIALEAISTHLPPNRFTYGSVLGVGGSGIVLRLVDKLFPKMEKALKFPRPVPGKVSILSELLEKEISSLAGLRHPGIVGISYYHTLKAKHPYEQLPYYLMECISGLPSRDCLSKKDTTPALFHKVLVETAEILAYLHGDQCSGYAHLDIKPENILITSAGHPILIDLGTCKRILTDDARTTVLCTRTFAHPELIRKLTEDPSDDNRAKGELARSEIKASWDLWAFGLTLLDWLGVDRDNGNVRKNAIYHRLSAYSRKYYMLLTARLQSDSVRVWITERVGLSASFIRQFPVTQATDLVDLLRRLDGSHNVLMTLPELDLTSSATLQAAPGSHVPLTKRLSEVLSHRLYRRLNSITQLGVVSQVYPNAKHTRREHSLGTYANTCRMLHSIYNDSHSPLFRQTIQPEDCRAVLLAALLHDLGQFPLAHDLEEIDENVFSHTELTQAMLRGEVNRKRRGSKRISFDSLSEVFALWDTTSDRVLGILAAKPSTPSASPMDKLLRSIISGPIDADKLDYLFRDARQTDVPYPFGIDVDRLFRCLTCIVIDRADGVMHDTPGIGIHAKAKVTAEFLTLARYAMFSQVYWHHAVRAQKAMLFRAVEALLAQFTNEAKMEEFRTDFQTMVSALPELLFQVDPVSLFPETENKRIRPGPIASEGTDLAATDAAVLTWLRERLKNHEKPEAKLIDEILQRDLYKRLWVISYDMDPQQWDKLANAWDRFDRVKRHAIAREFESAVCKFLTEHNVASITGFSATDAKQRIDEDTRGERPWLLIDFPAGRPGSESPLFYVLEGQRRQLRKDDRAVGKLQTSAVWDEYARNLRRTAGKIRVFCRPDLVETVEESVTLEQGMELLEDVLSEMTN